MSVVLAALAFVAIVLAIYVLLQAAPGGADDLLPDELKGARLVMSEKTLERRKPVHVRGRPDEVWIKDGLRVIIETKSRAGRVFEGDRMQLAAYAYMLRGDGQAPLAPHGFVRFTGGGAVTFQKVKLKTDSEVIDAHRRLQRVLRKKEPPHYASSAALCRGCGHVERCSNPKVGR